jgi:DNA-directed RNA polymerase subunit RPC12/RpoP
VPPARSSLWLLLAVLLVLLAGAAVWVWWYARRAKAGPVAARRRLGLIMVLAFGALVATAGLVASAGGDGAPPANGVVQEYSEPFHGDPRNPGAWQVSGPDADTCVRYEPAGLRITLPRGYPGTRPSTGVTSTFGVKGDFDVTVGFEVLAEPEPPEFGKDQTRFSLGLILDTPHWQGMTLSRKATSKQSQKTFMGWVSLWNDASGKNTQRADSVPTDVRKGRLRAVRTGDSLVCYAAADGDDTFLLVKEYAFPRDDLKEVHLMGSTGDPQVMLDVRVTDFHCRAEAFPGLSLPAAPVPAGPARGFGPAALVGLVLAVGLALALAVWLGVRRTRRAGAVRPAAPRPAVSWACAACGKTLRARAALAGKKVRCPQCGQAVLVPGTAADGGADSPRE